jgi:hypothetical protein
VRCGGEKECFRLSLCRRPFLVGFAKQIIDVSGLRKEGSFKMASDRGSVRIKNSSGVELGVLRR